MTALFNQKDCVLSSSDNDSELQQGSHESNLAGKALNTPATVVEEDLPRKRGRPKKSTVKNPGKISYFYYFLSVQKY